MPLLGRLNSNSAMRRVAAVGSHRWLPRGSSTKDEVSQDRHLCCQKEDLAERLAGNASQQLLTTRSGSRGARLPSASSEAAAKHCQPASQHAACAGRGRLQSCTSSSTDRSTRWLAMILDGFWGCIGGKSVMVSRVDDSDEVVDSHTSSRRARLKRQLVSILNRYGRFFRHHLVRKKSKLLNIRGPVFRPARRSTFWDRQYKR